MPSSVTLILLKKMQNDGLISLNKSTVEIDATSRMKLAIKAINLGADVERVSDLYVGKNLNKSRLWH